MKPILKIKTKMTKKDHKNFYYLVAFRKDPLKTIFILIFTLAISLLSNMNDISNIAGILKNWAIFSGVIIVSIVVNINSKVGRIYSNKELGENDRFVKIDFYDDFMKVHMDDKNNASDLKYDDIHKVYETKRYFLIYLNKSQASIIRKEDLDNENELRELLKVKCTDKYKKI